MRPSADLPTTNRFEATHRAVKVDRIIRFLDHAGPALSGPITADAASRWSDAVWDALALRAEVNTPSPQTRQAVVAVLRDRERHPDPFAGIGGS